MKILNNQQVEMVSGGFVYILEEDILLWNKTEMNIEYNIFLKEMEDYFDDLRSKGIKVIEI